MMMMKITMMITMGTVAQFEIESRNCYQRQHLSISIQETCHGARYDGNDIYDDNVVGQLVNYKRDGIS